MSDDKQWWSLWSIRTRWRAVYSAVFATTFSAGVILKAVYECCLDPSADGAVKSALDILQGSGSLAIGSAAYALIGTELVMMISEWYRAKRFAEGLAVGKAEGRTEGRAEGRVEGQAEGRAAGQAEAIKTLRAQGYEAAAEALEAQTQEQDALPQQSAQR